MLSLLAFQETNLTLNLKREGLFCLERLRFGVYNKYISIQLRSWN